MTALTYVNRPTRLTDHGGGEAAFSYAPRCQNPGRAMSLIIMPSTGVIPAMAVEGIVNPACVRAIRRPPKRPSPDRAYNTADHSTRRPGDQEPGPGTECCANCICLRARRSGDHSSTDQGGR